MGKKSVKLIDINNPETSQIVFDSMSSLIEYIKHHTGDKVSHPIINKYAESEAVFKDRWIIKFVEKASSATSVMGNLDIQDISSTSLLQEEKEDKPKLRGTKLPV